MDMELKEQAVSGARNEEEEELENEVSNERDEGGEKISEGKKEKENKKKMKMKKKERNRNSTNKKSWLMKFGCLRVETDEKGNVDMSVNFPGELSIPPHLVVMVNGLIGSSQNWRYAAKQFLKMYPRDVVVHCSERNYSTFTFDGVDVMGDRLADEVRSVIKRHPSVQKISFIGHSLGGLVARYAIARLYQQENSKVSSEKCGDDNSTNSNTGEKVQGKIAGLEPVNFITSATPHLGSRGHKQVPLFRGFYSIERLAARMSWCLGRTGKHLFLTDNADGKPPLLLRMVSDWEDLKFMSALSCFKRRVAYANTSFDHLVGWSTSSIRHRNELPKLHQHIPIGEKYPHVKNIEMPESAILQKEVQSEANGNGLQTADIEEEMLRGLTKLGWERVDVNFRGSIQRLLAHSTIQVKTYRINNAGADVIQHMVDNFLL